MSIGIYKITNPNGRIYIGQSINIEQTWQNRYKSLNCVKQTSIYNSLKKHGPENHIFEIVEECNREILNEREIFWGLFYDVLNNKHLNHRLGNANGMDREETKMKKRLCHKGRSNYWLKDKKLNKDHCDKISKAKIGYKYSSERGEKISKAKKGIPNTNHIESVIKAKSIKVYRYDLNLNFIDEFQSAAVAAKLLGFNQANIYVVLDKEKRSCKGFIWKTKKLDLI